MLRNLFELHSWSKHQSRTELHRQSVAFMPSRQFSLQSMRVHSGIGFCASHSLCTILAQFPLFELRACFPAPHMLTCSLCQTHEHIQLQTKV